MAGAAANASENPHARTPRWVIVLGLAVYCSLIWGIAIELGAVALKGFAPKDQNLAQAHGGASQDDSARR